MIKKEIIAYNTDASRMIGKVEKVVFPKNVKEVSEIIKITNLDIVPRGAGSGFEGGVVPNNSLVMDMTKMNRIISFNPSKRVIVVEAGIIIKELNEKLIAKGYEFPIDILNKGISTIGGMVATNASGKRAMKYGSIRDWLDEIEFVNGKGEIIKTSKADLTDARGMEGITGVITSVKIRVLPKIRRSFSIFQTDKLDDVLHVGRRLKSEKEVCSIILFSKQISRMLGLSEKYYLLVEFDSQRGKITGEEYENLLKKIENIYYTLGLHDYYSSEDPRLFFDKIKEFLDILELENTPYFGYLGNGIIHPFFKDSEKEKRRNLLEYIRRTQIKLGKYGFGIKRKDFLDSFESKLIQRVKQRHDPSGKLNRGKLVDFIGPIKKPEPRPERVEKNPKENILKDSFKDERLEIKPNLGEELTSKFILCEEKTPEEKINELIKEAESKEDSEKRLIGEQTRLSFIERREVENFAREIPREIIKQTTLPLKPRLVEDYNVIKHDAEQKESPFSSVSPKQLQILKKPGFDDAEQKPEEKIVKKTETSQSERDLINKIMGNRFGNISKGEEKK